MRSLHFIFIGIITSLFVTNAAFLRRTVSVLLCGVLSLNSANCYSFLDNYGKADAAAPPSKQIDLTGTWIGKGSNFTIDQRGCTLGYAGRLTADGQDTDQGTEFTVAQRGNRMIIPDQVIAYSGGSSGSYTQHYQGTVSGNRVRFRSSTNALGQFTVESTGTVSNDGNTVTFEGVCKTNAGSATAKGTFTWTRQQAPNVNLTGTWIGKGSNFTIDQRGCTLGYAGRLTTDGQDTDQGTEFTVAQRGNQLIIPDQVITYSGGSSGSYTQHYQGTVSGNRVRFRSSTNALGQFTVESTGTVSNDGNTVTFEGVCKTNAGSATAKGTFTWT